jgi:hypothetical protein
MPHDVSSDFLVEIEKKAPLVARRFTIGTSDYTEYVTRWPKITKRWNDIRPINVAITLSNEDQAFDFFIDEPYKMSTETKIEFGVPWSVESAGGTDEYLTLHEGKISNVKYTKSGCTLSVVDKIKPFAERVLGDEDNPLDYTGSDYLPSDLAWYWATSYGGLDNTKSTANTDIDYDDFSKWAEVFSSSSILCQAYFKGTKLNEAFRKLGRITRSSIYVEDGKLRFARYTETSSIVLALGEDPIIDVKGTIEDKEVINKHITFADYNVNSETYSIVVNDEDSTSVNTYGLREQIEKDANIWYVNSDSAIDLSQRIVLTQKNPYLQLDLKTTAAPITRFIGDLMTFQFDKLGIGSGAARRLMGYGFDLNSMTMDISVNDSQIVDIFRLDISQLDIGKLA